MMESVVFFMTSFSSFDMTELPRKWLQDQRVYSLVAVSYFVFVSCWYSIKGRDDQPGIQHGAEF
jgi:hypothetical protein